MTTMNGKVALVTGAGSGIGLATAKAFAQAGASVVLADRHEDAVRGASGELTAGGRKALAVRCDVTNDRQVASMIDQTVSTFGRLDAAFNNAGVMQRRVDTADITDDEWAGTRSSWTAATRHVERSTGRTEMKRLAVTVILVSLLAAACFHASPGGRVSGSDGTSVASRTATARSRSEGVPPMLTLNEI